LSQAEHAVKALDLQYPVLYDTEAAVAKEYQVFDLLHDGVATPAVFLLDKNGRIRWEYIGRSKSDRPSNSEIIRRLRGLEQEVKSSGSPS